MSAEGGAEIVGHPTVLLLLLLLNHVPFRRYFAEIAAGRFIAMLTSWGYDRAVSPEVLDLLNGLMCPDPARRLTMAQVEAHPWFRPLMAPPPVAAAPHAGAGGTH